MNEVNIEKLIKLQGAVNKDLFHLSISINLSDYSYEWVLFKVLDNFDDYMAWINRPVMSSNLHTINELETYLLENNGIMKNLLKEEGEE